MSLDFYKAVAEVEEMGARRAQNIEEAKQMFDFFIGKKIEGYLEIGVRHGWTFHLVAKLIKPKWMIAVDLPGVHPWGDPYSDKVLEKVVAVAKHSGINASVYFADSTHPLTIAQISNAMCGELADLTFIDGDHRLEGVTADFNNYWPMTSKYCVFHDTHTRKGGVQVIDFWGSVKKDHKHHEIHVPNGMGLGILER